jgi:hypothetical protein
MIPLESVMSKVWNNKIFKNIQEKADEASKFLQKKKVLAPMQQNMVLMKDFLTKQRLHQLLQFQ